MTAALFATFRKRRRAIDRLVDELDATLGALGVSPTEFLAHYALMNGLIDPVPLPPLPGGDGDGELRMSDKLITR